MYKKKDYYEELLLYKKYNFFNKFKKKENFVNLLIKICHGKKLNFYHKNFILNCNFFKNKLKKKNNFFHKREKMANVSILLLKDFEYGCELTISIAEYIEGPYVDSKNKINKLLKKKKKFIKINTFAVLKKNK